MHAPKVNFDSISMKWKHMSPKAKQSIFLPTICVYFQSAGSKRESSHIIPNTKQQFVDAIVIYSVISLQIQQVLEFCWTNGRTSHFHDYLYHSSTGIPFTASSQFRQGATSCFCKFSISTANTAAACGCIRKQPISKSCSNILSAFEGLILLLINSCHTHVFDMFYHAINMSCHVRVCSSFCSSSCYCFCCCQSWWWWRLC